MNPPQTIRVPQKAIVVCKMQERTVRMLKQLLIVSILLTIGSLMMSMLSDPTMMMTSPMFTPAVMSFIAIFFAWQFLCNKLVYQIEIVPNKYIPRKKENPVTNVVHKDTTKESIKEEPKKESLDYSPAIMNTKAVSYMIAIIGLVVFKLILIWTIDVAISGLLTSASLGGQAIASNGFYLQSPAKLYHLALYCLILTVPLDTYITMKIMQTNRGMKKSKAKLPLPLLNMSLKGRTTFGFISNVLTIPFVIMVMIFLGVAHTSGTGITVIYWNAFGEMAFETILFVVCSVIIFVGLIINFKRWRHEIKK